MLNFGNKEFRNLQEQVLQNARDIATLKGRENLQIVIVEELPETGNPNYIYLVPNEDGEESNVYNEYIWLADEEAYEQIGAVNIDLTNYVTTDTEQTVTGVKIFQSSENYTYPIRIKTTTAGEGISIENQYTTGHIRLAGYVFQFDYDVAVTGLVPNGANRNLGKSDNKWKDLYLSGNFYLGTAKQYVENTNLYIDLDLGTGSADYAFFGGAFVGIGGTKNLGTNSNKWQHLYLSGNLNDGTNTVTVANIASKVVSSFISGTFDSNGESTIDTEQTGTPEGLFIFTYGNCQCLMRLTATMVQNADVTPINMSCPMIYNSGTVNGWLSITKSGTILVLTITDGTNHVDSGYAWTLVKTGLI